MLERREHERISVGLFVRHIVGETESTGFTMNLSEEGLLLERSAPLRADVAADLPDRVQVEIPLRDGPGREDPERVWGVAEIVHEYESPGDAFVRTALRFVAMAERDRARLASWLRRQTGGERWEDLGNGVRVLRPA